MQLTYEQKQEIFTKGYIKIPGVVPKVMVDEALRAINHSVGEGMNVDDMDVFRQRSYCPEIQKSPVITDLLNKTPALKLAESAISRGEIKPVERGQIALRFPTRQDPPGELGCHLDGMHSPHNGVPKGKILNFTMLVGVYLNALPGPYCGNLAVWPGSHHIYESYFKERGPESLLDGMPKVELPEAEQITVEAGEIVLSHYQVAHGNAPNISPNVRYAIYFRLSRINHDSVMREVMTNIWLEWEGMKDVKKKSQIGNPKSFDKSYKKE